MIPIFKEKISLQEYLLVMLRVYLGVILLITVLGKLTDGAPFIQIMTGFLNAFASRESPFYVSFVNSVVLPNAKLLAIW